MTGLTRGRLYGATACGSVIRLLELPQAGPPERLVWSNPKGSDDERQSLHGGATEQKIRVLLEGERSGTAIIDVCREHRISEQTYHRWKRELGMLEADRAKQLKELKLENERLKRVLADLVGWRSELGWTPLTDWRMRLPVLL